MTATLRTREKHEISDARRRISQVEPAEQWWVDHRSWLENRGYLLRPRFTPGWSPSWHDPKVNSEDAEDRFPADKPNVLDATKLPFGEPVMLKRVNKLQSKEVEITAMLSSPALLKDPRNHCIPVYDVLEIPDDDNLRILVLPLLRKYDDPPFDTVGEVVDCLRQVLECVHFLHEHNIVHGNIEARHIMMHAAPLYDAPFHPVEQNMRFDWRGRIAPSRTRTEDPVEYHILDFSRASVHDPHASEASASDKGLGAADDDVDDPFAHDVYSLGTWIRDDFLKGTRRYKHLDVLDPLVDEMTRDDPVKRPTMKEVMSRFEGAIGLLSSWKLRSRAMEQVYGLQNHNHHGSHWARRLKLIAMSRPAAPSVQNDHR
ncbi:uncharacterized protein SCHCODRAFT_02563594 [Schizophyllum commune H4-8]|uniref:uncharacterized protein n=1 Tax=Schizophyllum commune (strain H4-8 / FGSC 9210) TaxID=578458 RepID=UPI00215DE835|nr:uncharacterized protein SCHCODRAFT_02563594 [Schizophyllum commune H4-8]KAI5900649.1 hypothetical protein SCHCODRAFT_02563594 [Schizophyllum commune H4-8]